MSEVIERLERIEKLLIALNSKVDHFLGYESLTKRECEELRQMREEARKGEFVKFEELLCRG